MWVYLCSIGLIQKQCAEKRNRSRNFDGQWGMSDGDGNRQCSRQMDGTNVRMGQVRVQNMKLLWSLYFGASSSWGFLYSLNSYRFSGFDYSCTPCTWRLDLSFERAKFWFCGVQLTWRLRLVWNDLNVEYEILEGSQGLIQVKHTKVGAIGLSPTMQARTNAWFCDGLCGRQTVQFKSQQLLDELWKVKNIVYKDMDFLALS